MDLLRTTARTARTRGASESAVVLLRRALEEPVDAHERTGLLLELGIAEILVDGPAGVVHLSEAYSTLDDDGERARLAMAIARTHVFVSPPGVATDFARRAAAEAGTGLDDERQGLVALQRITGFMHGLPVKRYRADPVPEVSGDGDGARMLAAALSYELLRDGTERDRAAALARFALEGDRLLAVDNGLLWIVAANVLLLADEDLGDFWERAMARAHAGGELFAALSVNLWRGFTQWRHGRLDDALQSLVDAAEQQRMWGVSAVTSTYAAAFTLGVLLDQGDLQAASASLVSARSCPGSVRAAGCCERPPPGSSSKRVARPRRWTCWPQPVDYPEVRNPAWAPWRGLEAQALAVLGQADRALALVDEEVALLRDWGAASALGRSLRLRGELRGVEGTADLREAVDVLSGTPVVVEAARAQVSLARSPGIDDLEAVALLESALGLPRVWRAGRVRDAVAEPRDAGGHPGGRWSDTRLTGRQRRVSELSQPGSTSTRSPNDCSSTGDGALRPRVDPGARTVTAGPQRRAAQTCGHSPRWFKSSSSRFCHARTPRS